MENWAVREERSRMEVLEAADEKKTICKYLSCGLIILVVVGASCYYLWMRVAMHCGEACNNLSGPWGVLNQPKEKKSQDVDLANRRVLIKHLMEGPALMEAQSLTWKEIDGWAKKHPTKPVHIGMVLVLENESEKYKKLISNMVYHKLVDLKICDENHVCSENSIAGNIRARACPRDIPCSPSIVTEIDRQARQLASVAVDGAFKGLRDVIEQKKGMAASSVAANMNKVQSSLIKSSTYENAASTGMGYQPAGYIPTYNPPSQI
ncbi:hypothetical protein GUITHDRAFT_114685 [Guillardia theta CCMP2712]|uniref:Uncharacterized protein n=1 Tax=Guillardia theta (strain CCMP2712) TaxID=905079 RepID=L1ITP3_GUITC|nr:hypothetical protein GUITHDRAFT_114685 [Guillardia theta CCMP2712]EKX39249.1 hypothetical protein GUITHDRAFT_114685 [Guillardia theta CCMP2712]|eukprot:XP_005826229.1 hypothetical protein GUITHDRAFT_114685 [Guillardia theta CCMP2712]